MARRSRRRGRRPAWVYDKSTGLWYAAVAVDTVTSSGAQIGANTVTFSFNNTAGDFLLVSSAIYGSGMTVTSATYNGVSLSSAMTAAASDNGSHNQALWKLVAPATGAHNVVVNLSGSNNFVVVAASFTGVDQTTPLGTCVGDGYSGSGTSHSHNTTSETNGLVWDCFCNDLNAGTVTVNGGQTTQSGPTDDTASLKALVSSKAGGASVSTGYSWANDFYRWAHITAPIKPATAATGNPAYYYQQL